jgi:hypothetical protein
MKRPLLASWAVLIFNWVWRNIMPANRTARLIIVMPIALGLFACAFADRYTSPPAAPLSPQTAAPALPALSPTSPAIDIPTALPQIQVGSFEPLYLTYDAGTWSPALRVGTDGAPYQAPHGLPVQVLKNNQYFCEIHDNLGHGMGPDVKLTILQKQVGNLLYRVEQWTELATGNPILVVYQYPEPEQAPGAHRIELTVQDANGTLCMQAMEQVLVLSEAQISP